jgi:hypothetical protein
MGAKPFSVFPDLIRNPGDSVGRALINTPKQKGQSMNRKHWLLYMLVSAGMGLVIETIAWANRLWVFEPGWIFLPWALVWEGVCFGTLSYLVREKPQVEQCLVSMAVGGAGEVMSAWIVPFWTFPQERLLFINGLPWIVVFLTLLWGLYCPLLNIIMKRLLGVRRL